MDDRPTSEGENDGIAARLKRRRRKPLTPEEREAKAARKREQP